MAGFYRVSPGFTVFPSSFIEFSLVLLGFTGFYRVLSGFTGFYRVSIEFYRVRSVFSGFPGFNWILLGFYRVFIGDHWFVRTSCCWQMEETLLAGRRTSNCSISEPLRDSDG